MIGVLLAEDLAMLRHALASLLRLEPDIEVLSEVDSGDKILEEAHKHRPDVAVIDIDMPELDGLSAAAQLREQLPEVRVLILTTLGKPGNLRRALSAQVSGFMLKDGPPDKLVAAIRDVAKGTRVFDSQLTLMAWDSGNNPLNAREVEVLRLTADGANPEEIARRLFLSSGTVRNYLTTSVTKLNARNKIDAIRIAQELGWL
ncbi:DNA-binding response regulator [Microbispora sp. NPDC049125]|uniref:response regulator transcription factor n=1 Tax=Microbispora sp. NPDC049125 TaxID=3154929 RepID=UPI00346506CB